MSETAAETTTSIQARAQRPTPVRNAITASAARLTKREVERLATSRKGKAGNSPWQQDAWEMYDLVGEERFLANTLAQRIGQAHLYVGRVPEDDENGTPVPVESGSVADVLDSFGASQAQRSQILTRFGVNAFVAGEGWLVGLPKAMLDRGPVSPANQGAAFFVPTVIETPRGEAPGSADDLDLSDLEWRFLSNDEVEHGDGTVTLTWDGAPGDKIEDANPDDLLLIRVWRPHPRRFSEADSPTRASLPVLRELVGLTMHVSAQIDSRLAGAGLLAVRKSVKDGAEASDDPEVEGDVSSFEDSLIDTMVTPISDRSNASALVPLVVGVPDDLEGPVSDHFHYQQFSAPLDAEARELREEAIRRLALGQDTPPELLLGVGAMNHWGAWLVKEDVITTHVEPPIALFCDALTTQFLWPLLEASGISEEEARQYVVWYSVDHLISRPNRTDDAKDLFDRGVISAAALRADAGYTEEDAPETTEGAEEDPAVSLALELVKGAPSLVSSPGLPALVEQIRAVLAGPEATAVAAAEDALEETEGDVTPPAADDEPEGNEATPADDGGVPSTSDAPAEPPALAASGVGPVTFNVASGAPSSEAVRAAFLATAARSREEARRG